MSELPSDRAMIEPGSDRNIPDIKTLQLKNAKKTAQVKLKEKKLGTHSISSSQIDDQDVPKL